MKLFNQKQLQEWDQYTIDSEPIKSIDLMERASRNCVKQITKAYPNPNNCFHVFCGAGNNGGDGLAIARMLRNQGFECIVYMVFPQQKSSEDNLSNLNRIIELKNIPIIRVTDVDSLEINHDGIIVDAIFGSGLTRPVQGVAAKVITFINHCKRPVIAIDIPSGMDMEGQFTENIVHADLVLSIQQMKYPFLFEESGKHAQKIEIVDIGLSPIFEEKAFSNRFFITKQILKNRVLCRSKFSHKGSYGTAGLAVGQYQMMGAAVLATKACLRSGPGLVKVFVPSCGANILQLTCPEAILHADENKNHLKSIELDHKLSAFGIGCGIGTHTETSIWLKSVLENSKYPLILDADALNIISENNWLNLIPKHTIITPHPKEFDRLFGKHQKAIDRCNTQIKQSKELEITIILKGAYTSISTPNGTVFFNSTGNPGMAKGGSGDVLTGLITGLYARGYSSVDASLIGVYIHGSAGNLAAEKLSMESMLPTDFIKYITLAMHHLYS